MEIKLRFKVELGVQAVENGCDRVRTTMETVAIGIEPRWRLLGFDV